MHLIQHLLLCVMLLCTSWLCNDLRFQMIGLNSRLLCPLDAFVKGDLKETKGDVKKAFDKAWKDYETKL